MLMLNIRYVSLFVFLVWLTKFVFAQLKLLSGCFYTWPCRLRHYHVFFLQCVLLVFTEYPLPYLMWIVKSKACDYIKNKIFYIVTNVINASPDVNVVLHVFYVHVHVIMKHSLAFIWQVCNVKEKPQKM